MTPGLQRMAPLSETKEWSEQKHILGFIATILVVGGYVGGKFCLISTFHNPPSIGFWDWGARWSGFASSHSCWLGWTLEPVSQMVPDISGAKRSWLTQDNWAKLSAAKVNQRLRGFSLELNIDQLRMKAPQIRPINVVVMIFTKTGIFGWCKKEHLCRSKRLAGTRGECDRFHRLNLQLHFFVWKCHRLHNCLLIPCGRKFERWDIGAVLGDNVSLYWGDNNVWKNNGNAPPIM